MLHKGTMGRTVLGRTVLLVAIVAAFALAVLAALYLTGVLTVQTMRQAEVEQRGADVMPFDQNKTTHVFTPTEAGGVQKVVAKDPTDKEQVSLAQEHLKTLATSFSQGDFSDPAAIHGEDMPGLKQLEAGASNIYIRYEDLPDGGQITYTTSDPQLVSALHDWFNAQVSDHGAHATSGNQDSSGGGHDAMNHEQHMQQMKQNQQ